VTEDTREPTGNPDFAFLEIPATNIPSRPPEARILDFRDVLDIEGLRAGTYRADSNKQFSRCTNCGIPYCHTKNGCDCANRIPEWLNAAEDENWRHALGLLESTMDFPEFTGRVCPAPCKGICTHQEIGPVDIKRGELEIAEQGFDRGFIVPRPPEQRTGKRVAIVGSGPAGLAAANQLNKIGHTIDVYEQAQEIGGLLYYGIPTMKLGKDIVHRRIDLMKAEGVNFFTRTRIGSLNGLPSWHQATMCEGERPREVTLEELRSEYDAVLLCTGAALPRKITAYRQNELLRGHDLGGVYYAMEYLTKCTQDVMAKRDPRIPVDGLNVVIIGGGDTGSDCLAYALRFGAKNVKMFDSYPVLPKTRADDNPWPQQPKVFQLDYAMTECVEKLGYDPRIYQVSATGFEGSNGEIRKVHYGSIQRSSDGITTIAPEGTIDADIVFIATGYTGTECMHETPMATERPLFLTEEGKYSTGIEGLFATGDCIYGASLVVTAIDNGRKAAKEINSYLTV